MNKLIIVSAGLLLVVAFCSAFHHRRFDHLAHCNRFLTSSLEYREAIPIDIVRDSTPAGYKAKLDFAVVSNGDLNIGFFNEAKEIVLEIAAYNDELRVIYRCNDPSTEYPVEYQQKQPFFMEFSLNNDGLIKIREQNSDSFILETQNQCTSDIKYFDFVGYDNITAEYYYDCPKNTENYYKDV